MYEIFSQGGPIFMGVLMLILILLILVFLKSCFAKADGNQLNRSLSWLRLIGTLGLVIGILGQLIGIYGALSAIEQIQDVAPAILAGGLKNSMITTIFGLVIYIAHIVFSMILSKLQ